MSINLNLNTDLEANLASYTTIGQVIFTEDTINLVKNDGTKVNYLKDKAEVVSVLPTVSIVTNKPYLLSTDKSVNIYNGSAWAKYGGSGVGGIQLAGDISGGTASLPQVTGINGIKVNDITRVGTQPMLGYNPTTKNHEYYTINVGNIVNSSGDIVQPAGSPIAISQGQEVAVNHTAVTNDRMIIQVLEQIPGITSSDMATNFNTADSYTQQDNKKTTIGSGFASLVIGGMDAYTKLMLHMDGTNGSTSFIDSEISNIKTITSTNVTLNTTQSKFGGTSGSFNGNGYLSIPSNSDLHFGINDFTIDMNVYLNNLSGNQALYGDAIDVSVAGASLLLMVGTSGSITCYLSSNGAGTWNIGTLSIGTITAGKWYHIAFMRSGNNFYGSVNGVISSKIISSSTLYVGTNSTIIGGIPGGDYLNGYIDEVRVSNIVRWTANFVPPIIEYSLSTATTSYITTKVTSFSLSSISSINSLTISQASPTNTSVKMLVSFDGRQNWLYHDGTGWHVAVIGVNLSSTSFTNSNIYTDIQTYFTNLTIVQLTSDLSGLSIVPIQLDFAWLLGTTDGVNTPNLSLVTIGYTSVSHNEVASIGRYAGTNNDYGIKRVSSTTTNIKKLSTGTSTITPNLIIGV